MSPAHDIYAKVYFRNGDLDTAEEYISNVINNFPHILNFENYELLGEIQYAKGDLDRAKETFLNLKNMHPKNKTAAVYLNKMTKIY